MKSPVLKGRKTMIITPEAKLARVPCRAMPTAKPAAPSMATKLAVWMPNLARAAISTKAITPQ